MVRIVDLVDHDNDDEFNDMTCWENEWHQAVSLATVQLGGGRPTVVTELCIMCNLKLRTWKEFPDGD